MNTLFHASYSLNYHLVLVTKYRRRCITADMMVTLERVAREITTAFGGEVIEFSGEADHVHLLLHEVAAECIDLVTESESGALRLHQCAQIRNLSPR